MRILLIDDQPDILLITAKSLKLGGFEVIEARGGQEGIDRARAWQPDAILMDLMMPDMDGATLLSRLREDEQTCDIPVVVFTAKSRPSEIQALRALGVRGVVAKPFEPAELVAQLKSLLAR